MCGSWRFLVLIILCCTCSEANAQEDTSTFYQRLEKKAAKRKFTRWVYGIIFTTPKPAPEAVPPEDNSVKMVNPFMRYKDFTIREIKIVVLDPFGHSVEDTSREPTRNWEELGNRMHITTHKRVIRNLLLFKPNEKLDILKLSESERLIRSMPYVNDAKIYMQRATPESDSIDLTILVLDKWARGASGAVDLVKPNLKVKDRNIGGSGHQYEQNVFYNVPQDLWQLEGRYLINNIRRSFVSASAYYLSSDQKDQVTVSLDRPFYSPLAKWAGGAAASRYWIWYYPSDTMAMRRTGLNYNQQDLWLGKNIALGNERTILGQSSMLVLAGGYLRTHFTKVPAPELDPMRSFRDSHLILGSLGYSIRQYYKERYLYRYGNNEDVPEGLLLQVTSGLLKTNGRNDRYYAGASAQRGKHFTNVGYFSAGLHYGTFFNREAYYDGTLTAELSYFTDLIHMGKWSLRQFVYYRFVHGLNRDPGYLISINGSQLYGFNSPDLFGQSKMLLNLETVIYTPYQFLGFRVAPVVQAGFGMLSATGEPAASGPIYQAYSIGLLIRNENLLVNTIKFSVGYYPYVPGKGTDVFKMNPVQSYRVRLRDNVISKPSVIGFE